FIGAFLAGEFFRDGVLLTLFIRLKIEVAISLPTPSPGCNQGNDRRTERTSNNARCDVNALVPELEPERQVCDHNPNSTSYTIHNTTGVSINAFRRLIVRIGTSGQDRNVRSPLSADPVSRPQFKRTGAVTL